MQDVSNARRKWLRSNYLKCQDSIFWGNYHQFLPHLLLKIRNPALLLGYFHLSYVGFELPHNKIISSLSWLASSHSLVSPRLWYSFSWGFISISFCTSPPAHFIWWIFHRPVETVLFSHPILRHCPSSQYLSPSDMITSLHCAGQGAPLELEEREAHIWRKTENVCFHLIHLPTLGVI